MKCMPSDLEENRFHRVFDKDSSHGWGTAWLMCFLELHTSQASVSFSIKPCYLWLLHTDHALVFTPRLRHWDSMIFYPTRTVHVDAMEGGVFDLSAWTCRDQPHVELGKRVVMFQLVSGHRVKKSEGSLAVLRSACGSEAAGSVASLIKAAALMQSPIPINHRPCLEQLVKLLALRSWLRAWKWDERRCIIYESRAGKVPQTGLWLARSSWPSQQFSSSTPLPLLEFEPL